MVSDARRERLARLKAEADHSLRLFLRGTTLSVPASGARWSMGGSKDVATSSGAVSVNVNLMGGTIFLDDERRVRALAKEIKRLITEDKRRGLAV